jgi:hypothetical protein
MSLTVSILEKDHNGKMKILIEESYLFYADSRDRHFILDKILSLVFD